MSFVTITEAAELVNKSTQTLYRHIKSGKLSRESSGLLRTASKEEITESTTPDKSNIPANSKKCVV